MENGNAGCCSWRKSCCGGGCCSQIPGCCSSGQDSPESWKRPQYYNGKPGEGYGLAMAYGYGMRMGQMINGLISTVPKCYGGNCGGSLSEEPSKTETSDGSDTAKEASQNSLSSQNGAMSGNGIKQEPANEIKQEPVNGVKEEPVNGTN